MYFEVDNLDIVITRNCQLACKGCLVFSDHREVKGHIDPLEWRNTIKWWGKKIKPKTIHLFGGEPLMNPWLEDWVMLTKMSFSKIMERSFSINIQTNGILLSKIGRSVLKRWIEKGNVRISISKHNNDPDYLDKINDATDLLKSIIDVKNTLKIDESETEYWGSKGRNFSIVDWTKRSWIPHYDGYGNDIRPGHSWSSERYIENHKNCEAKSYIQLYKGSLWKCPPIAVLKDSIEQIGVNNSDWNSWFDYFSLTANSNDDTIETWLKTQSEPERICNMCFGDTRPTEEHFIKIKEIKNV